MKLDTCDKKHSIVSSIQFLLGKTLVFYVIEIARTVFKHPGGCFLTGVQVQLMSQNGRNEFDFMRGDEEYKYRMGGVNKYVMRARVVK